MKTEGREKTSQDISCNRDVEFPRTLDPLSCRDNKGQEPPHNAVRLASGYLKPGDKTRYRREDRAEEKHWQLARKLKVRENYPANLEPPLENAGHQKSKGDHQERSSISMIFCKKKVLETHPVKIKKTKLGRYQPLWTHQ